MRIGLKAARLAQCVRWWVRQVSGEAAYENYLRRFLTLDPNDGRKPLSPKEFYLDSVRRRYSTPSRCC
jgi:uncharacterized short protein YbdD (DUF466 family)